MQTLEKLAERIYDEMGGDDVARRNVEGLLRGWIATLPIPATCKHAWEPATVETLSAIGVAATAVPEGAQWCPICKSLRRPPRDAPLPPDLSPVERVTHIVARELSFASSTIGANPAEVVYGLMLVAADFYVQHASKAMKLAERQQEWVLVSRKALTEAESSANGKPKLSIVR